MLQEDEELFRQFSVLVERAKPFYRYIGMHGPSFYVTHAPCRNKYVGKLDTNSLRHQRNFRLDRESAYEQQLGFLKEEAEGTIRSICSDILPPNRRSASRTSFISTQEPCMGTG